MTKQLTPVELAWHAHELAIASGDAAAIDRTYAEYERVNYGIPSHVACHGCGKHLQHGEAVSNADGYAYCEDCNPGPWSLLDNVTLEFSVFPDPIETLLMPVLQHTVARQLVELRESFCTDMVIRDLDLPASWDEVDAMFRQWLLAQLDRTNATIPQAMKDEWAKEHSE